VLYDGTCEPISTANLCGAYVLYDGTCVAIPVHPQQIPKWLNHTDKLAKITIEEFMRKGQTLAEIKKYVIDILETMSNDLHKAYTEAGINEEEFGEMASDDYIKLTNQMCKSVTSKVKQDEPFMYGCLMYAHYVMMALQLKILPPDNNKNGFLLVGEKTRST
jgi:hypothetical protein